MPMKLPYKEGTWFVIPLRNGGFATGVVARSTPRGGGILGYFYGPRRSIVPKVSEVIGQKPSDAIVARIFGDLELIRGNWPILGQSQHWNREDWPMPVFVRREPFTNRIFKVYRSDKNPNHVEKEELVSSEAEVFGLQSDSLSGAGAVEIILTKLLA
jgi:hypothetical protein